MRDLSRLGRLGPIIVMSMLLASFALAGTAMTAMAGPPPPTVTAVGPKAGPNTGTTGVKIIGTGFVSGATATFSGIGPVPTTFVNSTQLAVNPPSVAPSFGAFLVQVTNPSGLRSTQNVFFNYFEALPARVATSLAAVANPSQPARLDVFIRGSDNALWHTYSVNDDGNWNSWDGLGGTLASAPAAVSWQDGNRIDVFVRGTDDGLYHRWWDGFRWNGWEGLGGVLAGAPAAVSWGPGRLDVFVRGTDNALYHKWWDGSRWNGWENLGGILTSDPGGVSWGPPDRRVGPRPAPRIDLFVRGTDNGVWHKWFDTTSWGGWEGLGGTLTTAPAVSATEVGDLEVFGLGNDPGRSLMHLPYFNRWLGWRAEGNSYWTSSLWGFGVGTVSSSILQEADVMVVTTDGAVWHSNLQGAHEGFGARPRSRR
jgi:Repeat of unknown function (DUF346)/IPT/TIG domain